MTAADLTTTYVDESVVMSTFTDPGVEYVAHSAPVCVVPYTYLSAVLVRKPHPLPGVGPAELTVWFHWTYTREALTRPRSHGIAVKDERIGRRLLTATQAGRIVRGEVSLKTDVNGGTYVNAALAVMGKYLNADLTRLGF